MHPAPNEELSKQPPQEKPNLKGDWLNICLLLVLYTLQGIPFGLACAIKFVLQNRGASNFDQAEFSLVSSAFICKILWSPVVDCLYSARIGRRKTWLVPSQYLVGIIMILISLNMDDWLGSETELRKPRIHVLTITFFCCIFLSATQDIAVDGWSLTMLQRRNVGHSGTCNSVGFIASQFFGYVLFTLLDSKDFCNKFRSTPKPYGMVSFAEYMFLWAIIFMATTTIILIFKKDNSLDVVDDQSEIKLSLTKSYHILWQVFKIKPIQMVCLLLLTCRIGVIVPHEIGPLKLMEVGVSRDYFAVFNMPLLPIKIILPFVLGKYLTGPQCMRFFGVALMFKIVLGIVLAAFIYCTPFMKQSNAFPLWYYGLLQLIYGLEDMAHFSLSLTTQAFFSQVSDPRFGGMYLTLMNTMNNLGNEWPKFVYFSLIDVLTWKRSESTPTNNEIEPCMPVKSCSVISVIFDGFYIEVILSTIFSIIWLRWGTKRFIALQNLNPSFWFVGRKSKTTKDELLLVGKTELCVYEQTADH